MGQIYQQLKAANTAVLVILGNDLARAQKYAKTLKLPFPVLADADRAIYHLYGLERALLVIQRTASIIVKQDGSIRYLKRATNPQTWLEESRELLGIVLSLE